MLCVLPQCVDVVEGVLGADLIGFHTYNYLRLGPLQLMPTPALRMTLDPAIPPTTSSPLQLRRHFRSCVIRLCGFTPEMDHVDHRGQRTKLGVFPIGANARALGNR